MLQLEVKQGIKWWVQEAVIERWCCGQIEAGYKRLPTNLALRPNVPMSYYFPSEQVEFSTFSRLPIIVALKFRRWTDVFQRFFRCQNVDVEKASKRRNLIIFFRRRKSVEIRKQKLCRIASKFRLRKSVQKRKWSSTSTYQRFLLDVEKTLKYRLARLDRWLTLLCCEFLIQHFLILLIH